MPRPKQQKLFLFLLQWYVLYLSPLQFSADSVRDIKFNYIILLFDASNFCVSSKVHKKTQLFATILIEEMAMAVCWLLKIDVHNTHQFSMEYIFSLLSPFQFS